MGGFYSYTDCRYAIINPEFLKDSRNRAPLFKCMCAKNTTSSEGYANTYKPSSAFSKNNHDEKIGRYFGNFSQSELIYLLQAYLDKKLQAH